MESSSKVRSVTRTADGDSLFFVPIHGRSVRDGSIHHASFRLETKSASGTQGRSARVDWRRRGKDGSEHRKLHTLTVVSWQVVVTGVDPDGSTSRKDSSHRRIFASPTIRGESVQKASAIKKFFRRLIENINNKLFCFSLCFFLSILAKLSKAAKT